MGSKLLAHQIIAHDVEVEGYPVRYRVIGEEVGRETVILVHGLSGSTLWWRHNIAALAQHYRVYLVDLPGFGSMHHSANKFVLKKASSWLRAWMDALHIDHAHLIGHSMGGYICMHLAACNPEQVMRLILVSPAVKPSMRSIFGYILPLIASTRSVRPSFLPLLFYDTLRAGPRLLLHAAHDLMLVNIDEEVQKICQPVLLVWGEHDSIVPVTISTQLCSQIANARLLILPKAGHVSMFDQPRAFNSAVRTSLQGGPVGN